MVFVGVSEITPYMLFVLAIAVVVLTWTELGLKVNTAISDIKRFGTQQRITFVISLLILSSTAVNAFTTWGWFSALGWFNSGVFVTSGFFILLEAFN